jgi:SAM-dependent methyltransferase
MLMPAAPRCPVCEAGLVPAGRDYSVEEIFELWKPVEFTAATIAEHRRQAPSTRVHRCTGCGLEVFLPAIIGTPAFYVEAYNLAHTQPSSTFTYSEDKWEFGQALADAAGGRRVFEFGCGNGVFLARLAAQGREVAGCEYNPAALAAARAGGLKVHGPADPPAAYGKGWDAVFAFHVLEHAADPVGLVESMRRMVKPGGLIGISVPDQDGPIRYIEPCVMNMPPHHATRWRRPSFEALARRLGLSIRRVALEPLLLDNHGYYSVHGVRHALPGSSAAAAAARSAVSLPLRLFFGGLRRLGVRYFPALHGQSIYVVMATPGG